MLQIGEERFRVTKAEVTIEIRHAAEARAMDVDSPNLGISIAAEGRTVASAPPGRDFWSPRAELEVVPLWRLKIRSLADLRTFSIQRNGRFYVFSHHALSTQQLTV